MLEILKFIFSSLWTWLGTAILLGMVVSGVVKVVQIAALASIGKSVGSKAAAHAIRDVDRDDD